MSPKAADPRCHERGGAFRRAALLLALAGISACSLTLPFGDLQDGPPDTDASSADGRLDAMTAPDTAATDAATDGATDASDGQPRGTAFNMEAGCVTVEASLCVDFDDGTRGPLMMQTTTPGSVAIVNDAGISRPYAARAVIDGGRNIGNGDYAVLTYVSANGPPRAHASFDIEAPALLASEGTVLKLQDDLGMMTFILVLQTDGTMRLQSIKNGGVFAFALGAVGTWHHVEVDVDYSMQSHIWIFVDGKYVGFGNVGVKTPIALTHLHAELGLSGVTSGGAENVMLDNLIVY